MNGERTRKSDVVELLEEFEEWPVGTRGRVISERETAATLEIASNRRPGVSVAIITVPQSKLNIVERAADRGA